MPRIVCVSDTHQRHPESLPAGDVLVHAGDATFLGKGAEWSFFLEWFHAQPHRHKVFVAGNHDLCFERDSPYRKLALKWLLSKPNVHYLEDSGVELEGLKFWGSPWQPEFMSWAFNLPRGAELKRHWDLVPLGTDVLVTHSPPYSVGDEVPRGERVGCVDMLRMVERVRPRLHIFGHVHEGYGSYEGSATHFVNASICNGSYQPNNPPITVDL